MRAAEAVAEILERTGETKSSLSAKSGVSRALIDDYLKGRRQPSVAQLERLGEAAGLRLDIAWVQAVGSGQAAPVRRNDPSWLNPDDAGMRPQELTVEERARVLEIVVATAVLQQRRPRGELDAPPFRALRRSGGRSIPA